jgi:hypothetical protein
LHQVGVQRQVLPDFREQPAGDERYVILAKAAGPAPAPVNELS